jgi:isoleucyl-tRNA synthetase
MGAEPRDMLADVRRLEQDVRRRWRQRGIGGADDHRGGPAYAVHTWTTTDPHRSEGARAAALVAADVVVRHRVMTGDAVELVGVRDDDGLRGLLACRPAGRPVDPTAAAYVDSVWWSLAQLWDAGLLVEAPHRSEWCPRCGAPRGGAELRATVDEATGALVRFPVCGDHPLAVAGASLLVDVTAPWTLPATTAVSIAPDADPVLAQAAGDDYPAVLDRSAVGLVLGADATVHRAVTLDELAGLRYRPPVALTGSPPAARRDLVIVADGTPLTATGLAPVAPATDADALRQAAAHGVAVVDPLEPDGTFATEVAAHAGQPAHDADPRVTAALADRGLLLRTTTLRRRTRRCVRCDAVVLPRARSSWFVVTTAAVGPLAAERAAVRGAAPTGVERPGWITGASDWPVSRAHGRGVPLPVWRCDGCAWTAVVAGRDHLSALAGHAVDGAVDDVTLSCPDCGAAARRLPLAVDPRYVAACAPFARFGFPHVAGSDAEVARHSHADLVVDPADSGAGWADALLVVATLLWHAAGHDAALRPPTRTPADAAALADRCGVDAARWALVTGTPDGAPDGGGRLTTLWSHARTLLADARDRRWTPADARWAPDVEDRGVLHRWVLAELAATIDDVVTTCDDHNPAAAAARMDAWLGDLDWYLASSAGAVADEPDVALATRHECLVTTAALLAPVTPLLADELYELLVRADDPTAPASIHRLRFPTVDPAAVDQPLRAAMAAARRVTALGRRARRRAGVPDGQALPEALVCVPAAAHARWPAVAALVCRTLGVTRVHRLDRFPTPGRTADGWQIECDDAHRVALDLAVEDARRSERPALREAVTR